MAEEKIICEISPSQVLNLKSFIYSFLAIALIITASVLLHMNLLLLLILIPLAYAFGKWLEVRAIKLKITDQRIILAEGVLNKVTNETELYRVRDSTIEEPF